MNELKCIFRGCIMEPTPDHHQIVCQRCEKKYVPEHWNAHAPN